MAQSVTGDPGVETYLARVPPSQRAALEKLRAQIRAASPGVTEKMSYGIPTFVHAGKNLVHMAAFKDHLSFFPGAAGVTLALAAELKGYTMAKGTIQFTEAKPIPAALVKKIVKIRVADVEARAKPAKKPKPASPATDIEDSRAALARVVRRVFPNAQKGELWRGIEGWRIPRPKAAAVHAQTGTYDPAFTVVGLSPRKSGLTVYLLDPGDYYVLEKHASLLAEDGLTTGRGCIYWTRKGVLPTVAIERLLRVVKARDAKAKPGAAHAPPTKAAAKRKATAQATAKARKPAKKPQRKR